METLMQDIKFSLRRLLKSPGFTAIAVIALALGIGANTAIFSVINGVLLRSLPYKDPEGIVRVWDNFLQRGLTEIAVSIPEYHDYKKESQSFEHMAAIFSATFTITDPGEPERVEAASVSYNFFPLLGVDPILGRTFAPEEDQAGNDNVALLSHELWQRRFGANQGVLGEKITIDGLVVTVIGVMPPGFDYPDNAAMWVPVGFTPQMMAPSRRGARNLSVLARIKPGVTLQQAQADMDRVASNLQAQNPDFYPENAGYRVTLVPLLESTVGKIRPMLLLVLGVVGFVLLIACINVANLLLARSYALQKGVAIRAALGANRARLVREFLTESVLLALAGGAAGLLLAYWGLYVLVAVSPKDSIPRIEEITLDASVLAFTFVVSLLTGVIFGIVPALQASKHDLNGVLKEGGRSSSGGGARHLLPNSLVVAEVAVTIILLTAAGVMIKSFYVLRNAEPGFNPGSAMTMRTYVPLNSKYRDPAQQAAFFEQSLEKIRQIPGVESAGASFYLPLAGASLSCSFLPESSEFTPGGNTPEADWRAISPGFFESLNIPLLKGRDFNQFDRPNAPLAVVIDQTLAEQYWPDQDPIGKRLKLTLPMVRDQWLTVVGVVGYVWNSKMNSMARPQVYTSFIQTPMPAMSFVVRGATDSSQLTAAVTREIHEVESLVPVYEVKSMQKIVSDSLGDSRLLMLLLSVFAGVALVLASVGIYGVMSYSVTQRTHEIGIRMAMGARATDVLQLVFRKGLTLTLIGAVIGLVASYAFARALSAFVAGLLYGTSATDLLVFLVTPLVLIMVAVFACFVPARRATRVDPVIALRFE